MPLAFARPASDVTAGLATDLELAADVAALEAADRGTLWKSHARLSLPPHLAYPPAMASPPTFATSGPGGSSPINSGSPTQVSYDDSRVTHIGQVNSVVTQFSTTYWQNTVNASWTPAPAVDEFDFYGDDLAIRFRAATSSPRFWVWVDGEPATSAPVILSSNVSAGSLSFYRVTFGSVALRRLRIHRYMADWGGVDIKPTHCVSATTNPGPSLFILGDSWVEGTGATTELSSLGPRIGRLLGMSTYLAGQGSTGYVADGAHVKKAAFGDSARIAQLASAAPEYVVVFGSLNDDGRSGIQAAAAACYTAIAAAAPDAQVFVVGPPATGGTPSSNRTANNTAVRAAALAADNVAGYIDPVTGSWISGTGRLGSTTGDGNADLFIYSDGAHPTQAGHDYYATRIAESIRAILSAT